MTHQRSSRRFFLDRARDLTIVMARRAEATNPCAMIDSRNEDTPTLERVAERRRRACGPVERGW